jgi:hypothetical protein
MEQDDVFELCVIYPHLKVAWNFTPNPSQGITLFVCLYYHTANFDVF